MPRTSPDGLGGRYGQSEAQREAQLWRLTHPARRQRTTGAPPGTDLPGWEVLDIVNESGTLSMTGGTYTYTPGADAAVRLLNIYFSYSISSSLDPEDIGEISIGVGAANIDHSLVAPGLTADNLGGTRLVNVAMAVDVGWSVRGLASLSGDIGSWFLAVEGLRYTGED